MTRIRPYKRNDAFEIELLPEFAPEIFVRPHIEEKALLPVSLANTMIDAQTEKPIAIFGLTNYWPGMAELWAVLSPEFKRRPILARWVKKAIDDQMSVSGIRRLQMTIRTEGYLIRWAIFLGFKHEGLMEKYGPDGLDYMMYGRVKNE